MTLLNAQESNANEKTFTNGYFSYNTAYNNSYHNGKITYNRFKIPYSRINLTVNGQNEEYTFTVNDTASGIIDNAYLLPRWTGTILIRNDKIIKITIDKARFGIEGGKGVPLVC